MKRNVWMGLVQLVLLVVIVGVEPERDPGMVEPAMQVDSTPEMELVEHVGSVGVSWFLIYRF